MENKHIELCINSLLGLELNDTQSFVGVFKYMMNNLPGISPERWGCIEPINKAFDLSSIEKNAEICNFDFLWKRISYPKGWGLVKKKTYPLKGPQHARHDFNLRVNHNFDMELVCDYIKKMSINFNVDYVSINFSHPCYEDMAKLNGGNFVPTWVLRKWLPDLFWGQVFGPPYIRLLGLDKLLSCPAYKVEKISEEMVYIQLSKSIFESFENYSEFNALRSHVKSFLDDDIFFDEIKSNSYVNRYRSHIPGSFFTNMNTYPDDYVYRTPDFFSAKPQGVE